MCKQERLSQHFLKYSSKELFKIMLQNYIYGCEKVYNILLNFKVRSDPFTNIYVIIRYRKGLGTSSQDGDVGRCTLPPGMAKRRTTTDLKTKSSQNCQRVELYGSLTTKELKKKHAFGLVGGAEMGSQGGEDVWQSGGWRTRWARWWLVGPHLRVDKPRQTTGD